MNQDTETKIDLFFVDEAQYVNNYEDSSNPTSSPLLLRHLYPCHDSSPHICGKVITVLGQNAILVTTKTIFATKLQFNSLIIT